MSDSTIQIILRFKVNPYEILKSNPYFMLPGDVKLIAQTKGCNVPAISLQPTPALSWVHWTPFKSSRLYIFDLFYSVATP